MSTPMIYRFFCVSLCFLLLSNDAALAACSTGTFVPTPVTWPASHTLTSATTISQNDAWMVGSVASNVWGSVTIAEHWDGSQWTLVPTPGTNQNQVNAGILHGVAAASSTDVWAVGESGTSPLIDHWDGARWSVVPSPVVGTSSLLTSVTATSPNNVWAAGSYSDTNGLHALTELWNGSSWSVVPNGDSQALTSISATSSTDVWATGVPQNDIEHWDGVTWKKFINYPASAISAVGANDVWIVWASYKFAHWDGSAWATVSGPNGGTLRALAANASNNAWAVGSSSTNEPLTEHWDGTAWTVVSARQDNRSGTFLGVSLSGFSALAVGAHSGGQGGEAEGLSEMWNGSRWRVGDDVAIDSNYHSFDGVFATDANNAWAVGYAGRALIEHWDGIQWTSGPVFVKMTSLADVGGFGANDVWAVGSGRETCYGAPAASVVHWNGRRWEYLSPHVCSDYGSNLTSVAVVGKDEVWAVGSYTQSGGFGNHYTHDLILHRVGSTWEFFGNSGEEYSSWQSVRADSANDVWFAGVNVTHGAKSYNVIDHWDGTTLNRTQVNNPERYGHLLGLGVVSPSDVWAVGTQSRTYDGPVRPLIEHWDGKVWSVVHHAPFVEGARLLSVTVVSASDVWAVGTAPTGPHVEHWNGHAWSVVTTSLPLTPGFSGAAHIPGSNTLWAVGGYYSPYLNFRALSVIFHC